MRVSISLANIPSVKGPVATMQMPSSGSFSTTLFITLIFLCDLIFHNENEPLPSDVLPSSKGEYIVVVKMIVEDNNYYGEKELTALLIIE